MSYVIKEIFYSLQGEGAQTGRPAVFCRFSGCNLWSGVEADRENAVCQFCDTDFLGHDGVNGGKYKTAGDLVRMVKKFWPHSSGIMGGKPIVICTGGEPLLQMDSPLIEAFHQSGFTVALETNGTLTPPPGIDWICVSPKAGSELVVQSGDELKLVFPQPDLNPEQFAQLAFRYFFLQPMDGENSAQNTKLALEYCLKYPQWRLSLQIHKFLNIP